MLGELVDVVQHVGEVGQVVVAAVRLRVATQQVGTRVRDVTAGPDCGGRPEPGLRQMSHAASSDSSPGSGRACTTVRPETARVSTT